LKKAGLFILILSYLNLALVPQNAEQDSYHKSGKQVDDINSFYEFIDEIVLGNIDDTPEDEDDDSGLHYLVVKTVDLHCQLGIEAIPQTTVPTTPPNKFFLRNDHPYTLLSGDVFSPPPEF
jgi:hypothetical protein